MKEEEKKEVIQFRRRKAKNTLNDAKLLFKNKSLFSTINRLYYALFYEVSALLLIKGLSSSKHSGTKALFHQHFVRTGHISKEMGKFYSSMFGFRQKSDYDDFSEFEEQKVSEWLQKAKEFIDAVEKVIELEDEHNGAANKKKDKNKK